VAAVPAGAGAVLDEEFFPKHLAELIGEQPAEGIGGAARRRRRDDAHRPRRPVGGRRHAGANGGDPGGDQRDDDACHAALATVMAAR
jgi:hypothetical protein